jgi:hypothetical protein
MVNPAIPLFWQSASKKALSLSPSGAYRYLARNCLISLPHFDILTRGGIKCLC